MATTRLVLAFSTTLVSAASVAAQLPTAPPPHLALDEVVKVHQQLELPVPPPGAELVRVNRLINAEDPDFFAFQLPPAHPHGEPRFFQGDSNSVRYFPFARVKPVVPTIRAMDGVDQSVTEALCCAVLCKLRGWDELARGLYAKARENDDEPPIETLRLTKWLMLEGQINERGSDRKVVYRQLLQLAEVAPSGGQLREDGTKVLRRLELTVAPRKSKPGTVEALIDDLVDYWHDNEDRANESGRETYWKLVEMGFDAVPALLDHLDDERYTYALVVGFGGFNVRTLRVGDLCGEIVCRLAGGKIDGEVHSLFQRGVRLNPERARKWWEATKRADEEKWLWDRIALEKAPGGTVQILNENVLRALGAKHPRRLQQSYRSTLQKLLKVDSGKFIAPILASRLTRDEKTALLLEGVASEDVRDQSHALAGLARLDHVVFRERLLLTLKECSIRLDKGNVRLDDAAFIVPLVARSQDEGCWDALIAVGKKLPYGRRMRLLYQLGVPAPYEKPDPIRRERLRFLVQFLNDRTIEQVATDWGEAVEIRDFAASHLMGILRFPGRRNYYSEDDPIYNDERGPLTCFVLRVAVRQAAESELAQDAK